MPFFEAAGNLHMHTVYSDGEGDHAEIAQAALQAGLDFVIVTDHNVWVDGITPYHSAGEGRRVLVLTGEEVHDQALRPPRDHLLVYNAGRELAACADDPQRLIDEVNASGGLSFLAHPFDDGSSLIHHAPIPWQRWEVTGFTGLELWNYMSEFVGLLTSRAAALRYLKDPGAGICGPHPEALKKWDALLNQGRRVVAIGSSDAHATSVDTPAYRGVVFPYEFLFRTVNTHLLLDEALGGSYERDRASIFNALRAGHCFVGYDLPKSTRGFRFSAQGAKSTAVMGDEIDGAMGVTLQVSVPAVAEIRMVLDGRTVNKREADTHLTYITKSPGAYRVEVYLPYKGARRGWIFSNPIYVR